MNVRGIVEDSRVARIRELKAELADAKARLVQAESDRDSLVAHFALALAALRDFEQIGEGGALRIIDGWNAILRFRNVLRCFPILRTRQTADGCGPFQQSD